MPFVVYEGAAMTDGVNVIRAPWGGVTRSLGETNLEIGVPASARLRQGGESCEAVLRSEALAQAKDGGICVAYPGPISKASNPCPDTLSIFVNGLNNSNGKAARSAELLAESLGRPVLRIHNDREDYPWIVGSVNAVIGKVSPTAGAAVEPSVKELADVIEKRFRNGGTVDLHVHSQGSVIGSNALSLLNDRLTAEEWRKLTSEQLRVTSYGAAEHLWPPGVTATDNYFVADYVAALTSPLDSVVGLIGSAWGNFKAGFSWIREKLCGIPGGDDAVFGDTKPNPAFGGELDQHPFAGYMNAQATFFVARHTTLGVTDGKAVAADLLDSIRRGYFADSVHEQVISRMVEERNGAFAKAFLLAKSDLGAFAVPAELEGKLREIAAAKNNS